MSDMWETIQYGRDRNKPIETQSNLGMEDNIMSLVYDKHEEEMEPLHDHLVANKMNFEQFLRTVNFVRDMSQEDLNKYIDAYKNGEFVWRFLLNTKKSN